MHMAQTFSEKLPVLGAAHAVTQEPSIISLVSAFR